MYFPEVHDAISQLDEMQKDGLLEIHENGLSITEKGKPFVRNICMAFDLRMNRRVPNTQIFSMTI